jgi:uroporphyrinogen decarboxylase
MFEHREADRVPIIDSPWGDTIERWHREGMPLGMSFVDFFDLDRVEGISVDNSPGYEARTLEETDEYRIYTTSWGATLKNFKHATSTPEFLDFKIKTPDDWLEAKKRMVPSPDRVPWDYLKANYGKWREQGCWLEARLWFGFDVTHAWTVGTENLLIALADNPDWCSDMFNHFLDVNLAVMDMVLDAGYEFDSAFWWDDMGYKQNQFFSIKTYRELLKPVQKRAIEWAHSHGMKAHLHSCGDIRPFVPELVEIGLDALNPLEVKAGMDPLELKRKYGKDLVFHEELMQCCLMTERR